jgi:LacI family repressor for deo operon, udp, cdd, tsx, nupC, and nupG
LAKELSFEPNPKTISFKQKSTFVGGVILPDIQDDFFSETVSGIEIAGIKNDYTILFGQSNED